MFFYSNPTVLFDEMKNAGKSVMFVPHNFAKRLAGKEKEVGMYCVEFNPFTQSEDSIMVLNEWIDCCIKSCSLERDGVTFGNQKYLDYLSEKNNNIHICRNKGAGIAPWNIDNFTVNKGKIEDRCGNDCSPIFFHFQGISFDKNKAEIDLPQKTDTIDYNVVDWFYIPYLKTIKDKREELSTKYNIDFSFSYNNRYKSVMIKQIIRRIIRLIPFLEKYFLANRNVSYII